MDNFYFTSESVSCGHPDKICDQISDAILDEFLCQDENSKVAVECFITNNLLVIGGEAHSNATVDIIGTAKNVIEETGYNGTNGFNPETAIFVNTLHEQSSDIRQGVDREEKEKQGAGDQGIMFGYACNETPQYMPTSIILANTTMQVYDDLRKCGKLKGCRPDAKCQYTLKYEDGKPKEITKILISMQHDENMLYNGLHYYVLHDIIPEIKKRLPELAYLFTDKYELLINPTGKFVIGGPEGDTGLTGRKIIVDTYGGRCPHGGGAFSGKDASKVDRSAAYAARYIAKNIVAAGIANECTVQLSYAIGMAEPQSIYVQTDNEHRYSQDKLVEMIKKIFPIRPYDIIKKFNLKAPIYRETATYGHFGRIQGTIYPYPYLAKTFAWEETDRIKEIQDYFNGGIK